MADRYVFTSVKALRGKEFVKGVMIKPLAGQHVMMIAAELAPDADVPTHSHPHEQIGMVIEGELEFWIGDERRTLRPGDMFMIPGGVPHGARAGKGRAVTVEAFYPLREEYLKV